MLRPVEPGQKGGKNMRASNYSSYDNDINDNFASLIGWKIAQSLIFTLIVALAGLLLSSQ
jgi:hypothetical protein